MYDTERRRKRIERAWCVYKHTSPSGKVYIGTTKNIKSRWRSNGKAYKGGTRFFYAIQKYGWENFTHEILQEGLTREEASNLEKEMIAKYRSAEEEYGYNLTLGGFDVVLNEDAAERKRKSLLGHPVSESVREILSECHSIPIICLETKAIYRNTKEAEKVIGICATSIGKNCNGAASRAGNYHFAKLSDYENGTIPQFKHKVIGKPVICLETQEVFKTQIDAAKVYGVSSQAISHCCTGKTETCAKKHWKFYGEDSDYAGKQNL